MNDSKSNIVGSILFFLLIITLAVGGYFLTIHLTKDTEENKEATEEVVDAANHKIDATQDYIYFSNEKFISMEPDITYKDVTINLDTAESINQALKSELNEIRGSVKYISDNELDPEKTVMYDSENIYSAKERNYETYTYKNYISLIVKDYDFNCYDGSLLKNLKSYIFDTSTGKMKLNNELFEEYNIDLSEVKSVVREKLNNSQTTDEDTGLEVILIDDTMNYLNNNYALYIDKYGDLYISFVVKTTQVDYNENIRLN